MLSEQDETPKSKDNNMLSEQDETPRSKDNNMCVWLRKQLKGTAWLSAVSSQSGRVARGARVLRVGASWAGRGAEIEV